MASSIACEHLALDLPIPVNDMNTHLDYLVNATRTMSLQPPDNTVPVDQPQPQQHENTAPTLCASCGKHAASLRCAVCKLVVYCDKKHQKAHWTQHKPFCVAPFQMGVHVSAFRGTEVLTPAFIPQSAASDAGLGAIANRRVLADMLQSTPQALYVEHAAISDVCATVGRPRIALVFDRKPDTAWHGLEHCVSVLTDCSRLCTEGSSVSVVGGQHRVLVFYLDPGRDLLTAPDYRALIATTMMWTNLGSPTEGLDLERLFQLHDQALSQQERGPDREDCAREFFDCIVFPALQDNPFITKLPMRRIRNDEDGYDVAFHTFESRRVLGEGPVEHMHPWSSASSFSSIKLSAVIRALSLYDGSPLNRSIQSVMKGRSTLPWSGNMIVSGQIEGTELARDVTKEEIDIMVDYFKRYGSGQQLCVLK